MVWPRAPSPASRYQREYLLCKHRRGSGSESLASSAHFTTLACLAPSTLCCDRTTIVAIFLGIDGGGSKTSAAIGDENSLLGTGIAAGSNVVRVGEAQARQSLAAAIRQTCAVANVTPAQVQRTCIGLAGAARPEIGEFVHRVVSDLVSGEIEVVGDMVIALEAAFSGGPGVIVIAGTGSIGYGRNSRGQALRAGGWGFSIFDEGSGHWIGRTAVTAALRAYDEAEPTTLLEAAMKAWGISTLEQLVLAANSSTPPDYSALFPAVLSASDAGDAVARGVLTRAGAELATLAKIIIRRLFSDAVELPVAMSGGVFRNCALIRQVFYNSVRSEYPAASVNATVIDPVRGALELARKGAQR
jgi:glucosamine kinase